MEKYNIGFTLLGDPRTKKNSPRMRKNRATGKSFPVPSAAFEAYHDIALAYLLQTWLRNLKINRPINLKCVYYMQTKRTVDLNNLLEATCDILADAGVIEDDNSNIVASHDGSRVRYDKVNPRVEITITEEDYD